MVRGLVVIPDVHFNPDATHALVASDSSLLVMILLVLKHNLLFKQLDVQQAFLNSPFEHDVGMRLTAGFVHPLAHSFAKLQKSLHGWRQAAAH